MIDIKAKSNDEFYYDVESLEVNWISFRTWNYRKVERKKWDEVSNERFKKSGRKREKGRGESGIAAIKRPGRSNVKSLEIVSSPQ